MFDIFEILLFRYTYYIVLYIKLYHIYTYICCFKSIPFLSCTACTAFLHEFLNYITLISIDLSALSQRCKAIVEEAKQLKDDFSDVAGGVREGMQLTKQDLQDVLGMFKGWWVSSSYQMGVISYGCFQQ